ncbi:MAG: hypothetical protein WCT50_04130 [Patescibacteria group bacterium]
MKTKIILFTVLLLECLFSCIPEKIDVVKLNSSDTIQNIKNIENRPNLSIGDTCIVEEHWFSFCNDINYPSIYTVLTKEEAQKRLKTQFAIFMLGNESRSLKRVSEGFVYHQAIVIAKY